MRYAAFLRGINLGSRRRVTADQLRAPLEALGFGDVASFLASGNLAFDADAGDGRDLETRLEAGLEEALGFAVETFVRREDEVAEVVAQQPFPAEVLATTAGKLQVTFLRNPPPPDALELVAALASDDDRLAVIGREWYWLPSSGMSQSALDLRALEKALGRGTTRTANTVARLHAKHLSR